MISLQDTIDNPELGREIERLRAGSLDGYQETINNRASWDGRSRSDALATCGLGVAGGAGEVADLLKKHLFHGHDLDLEKLKLELGDVLWYVAACARLVGLNLSEVAEANIAKLAKRYANGFTKEESINRKDIVIP